MSTKTLKELEALTKKELSEMAKSLELENYSKLGKKELVALVFNSLNTTPPPIPTHISMLEIKGKRGYVCIPKVFLQTSEFQDFILNLNDEDLEDLYLSVIKLINDREKRIKIINEILSLI